MRVRSMAMLSTLLIVVLLVPTGAWARRVTATGSLTITLDPPGTLTNQLVVTAVTVNRRPEGREGNEGTQVMPLTGGIYTVPLFVNKETTGPVVGDFDTVLFIVNVTSGFQSLLLTVRNLDGSIQATIPLIGGLAPNQTRVIRLSEVLT